MSHHDRHKFYIGLFVKTLKIIVIYFQPLTHNDTPEEKKNLENIVQKGEDDVYQHFLLLDPFYIVKDKFNVRFNFSAANALNFNKAKILSSAKGLRNGTSKFSIQFHLIDLYQSLSSYSPL